MNLFISNIYTDPRFFFIVTLVVVFSICLHEFFHAWAALQFGDTTAADRGHLTLNPLKQMGPVSIFMFLLLGFAWGAVPVNPQVLRARNRHAPAIVALAGPATNFVLFLIGFCVFGFLYPPGKGMMPRTSLFLEDDAVGRAFTQIFGCLGEFNAFLCIFNLLPVPGLDGWNVLTEYVPRLKHLSSEFAKGVMILLIFLLLFSTDYIFRAAESLMMKAPNFFWEKSENAEPAGQIPRDDPRADADSLQELPNTEHDAAPPERFFDRPKQEGPGDGQIGEHIDDSANGAQQEVIDAPEK